MLPTTQHELSMWCLAPESDLENFDTWLKTEAPKFAEHVHIDQDPNQNMFKFYLCGHLVARIPVNGIIKFTLACVHAGTAEDFTCDISI